MFPKASYTITADRYAPHEDYIDVVGYDFTGATTKMEVRDTPNGGTVRATTDDTVTVDIDVTTTEGVPTTRFTWVIPEVTMEAMPTDPADPSGPHELSYDMHITPSGGTKFVAWGGKFIVDEGTTQ